MKHNYTFYIIVSDTAATRIMQAADVFEPFKFIGFVAKFNAESDLGASEFCQHIANALPPSMEGTEHVAAWIPGHAPFLRRQDLTVLSDGRRWARVDGLITSLGGVLG
jgi:hypothetical protein